MQHLRNGSLYDLNTRGTSSFGPFQLMVEAEGRSGLSEPSFGRSADLFALPKNTMEVPRITTPATDRTSRFGAAAGTCRHLAWEPAKFRENPAASC